MQPPSPNGNNGRDGSGRFAPGNRGGPGNPHARAVGAMRAAFLRATTEDDIQQIAQTLVVKAKGGDLAAARLLLGYVIGRMPETVDPDRMEEHEHDVLRRRPTALDRQLLNNSF